MSPARQCSGLPRRYVTKRATIGPLRAELPLCLGELIDRWIRRRKMELHGVRTDEQTRFILVDATLEYFVTLA